MAAVLTIPRVLGLPQAPGQPAAPGLPQPDADPREMVAFILNQPLVYTDITGAQSAVTWAVVDAFVHHSMRDAAVFACRIGVGLLALLVLFMMLRVRTLPVFVLNQLLLGLMVLQLIFYLALISLGLGTALHEFTGVTEHPRTGASLNAAANVFQVLLIAAVELSLVYQAGVMFHHHRQRHVRWLVVAVTGTLGSVTTFWYLLATIARTATVFGSERTLWDRVLLVTAQAPILFAVLITVVLVLMAGKLVAAIRTRRCLGLRQFDGLHVLFIMMVQLMAAPTVLTLVAYGVKTRGNATLVITPIGIMVAVLSLPLTAAWLYSTHTTTNPVLFSESKARSSSESMGPETWREQPHPGQTTMAGLGLGKGWGEDGGFEFHTVHTTR